MESRFKEKAVLIMRLMLVCLVLFFVGQWLVPPPTQANTGFLQVAQLGSSMHTEDIRSDEFITSATLAMERATLETQGDNRIDFNMLVSTQIYAQPPPIWPDKLESLDGKTVKILGFMSPYDSLRDLRNFMLMNNPTGCYFCIPPSPKEVVLVRWKSDTPQEFVDEPIEVTGTLKLWNADSKDDAHRMFLYVIDDAKIRPLKM